MLHVTQDAERYILRLSSFLFWFSVYLLMAVSVPEVILCFFVIILYFS